MAKKTPVIIDPIEVATPDIEVFRYGYISGHEIYRGSDPHKGGSVNTFSNISATIRYMEEFTPAMFGISTEALRMDFGERTVLPDIVLNTDKFLALAPVNGAKIIRTRPSESEDGIIEALTGIYSKFRFGKVAKIYVDELWIGVSINEGAYIYSPTSAGGERQEFVRIGRLLYPRKPKAFPKLNPEFTLGADPELLLYYTSAKSRSRQNPVSADTFFRRMRTLQSIVGTDGCSSTFEIRPPASSDPKELTENVRDCLKLLATRIACIKAYSSSSIMEMFLEAGGGAYGTIGGHIHFGGEAFKKHRTLANPLGTIMDTLLYYPIRETMYGGIRGWVSSIDVPKSSGGKLNCGENRLMEYFAKNGPNKDYEHSEYDIPNSTRPQEWGLEYRSLPSFIADPMLTYLVFAISKGIGNLLINSFNDGQTIKLNGTPTQEDYLKVISLDDFRKFCRYTNGDKRDVFLTDVFTNWGIDVRKHSYFSLDSDSKTLYKPLFSVLDKLKGSKKGSGFSKKPTEIRGNSLKQEVVPIYITKDGANKVTSYIGKLQKGDVINAEAIKAIGRSLEPNSIYIASVENADRELSEVIARYLEDIGETELSDDLKQFKEDPLLTNTKIFEVPKAKPRSDDKTIPYPRNGCHCASCEEYRRRREELGLPTIPDEISEEDLEDDDEDCEDERDEDLDYLDPEDENEE